MELHLIGSDCEGEPEVELATVRILPEVLQPPQSLSPLRKSVAIAREILAPLQLGESPSTVETAKVVATKAATAAKAAAFDVAAGLGNDADMEGGLPRTGGLSPAVQRAKSGVNKAVKAAEAAAAGVAATFGGEDTDEGAARRVEPWTRNALTRFKSVDKMATRAVEYIAVRSHLDRLHAVCARTVHCIACCCTEVANLFAPHVFLPAD
eukprot:SAG31_NODE_9325_length_1297_cov_1.742905_1_plen_209_part_00